ncbi:hypothetical protein AGMMS49546_32710 [Spirochaetia bacterium]|nr:hypothetical protein AGMMS49546_32710 [Spirochaetia bacterium]
MNGLLNFLKREKLPAPPFGDDSPLNDLHCCFHRGFIGWPAAAGRHNNSPVMVGHFLVGFVQHRVIVAGLDNRRLRVVRNEQMGYTIKIFKGMDVGVYPGFYGHVPEGSHIQIRAGR